MRIFVGESDRSHGRPLHQVLLELFRREGIAGATVLRAIAGYGATSHLHTTNLLRLSTDLPLVIEVVDEAERIEALLPRIEEHMQGGLITLERARVIRYGPG